ncbi:PREDICTED: spermatogenesis-associated protein 8 [Propithecus coquereli]|uniref:spermatogenesis-associated protein 8 n=1 Tax=Propithecus coquereli TaxID=379532 RepID=UPI00063FAB4E|nr:PREDICTED: spermatogenesis-associated protein 8 [Propithecus coquereli]
MPQLLGFRLLAAARAPEGRACGGAWAGDAGARESACLCLEIACSFQMPPSVRDVMSQPPSRQQFPEATTCPCSWRLSKGDPGGIVCPVWSEEKGSFPRRWDPPKSRKEPEESKDEDTICLHTGAKHSSSEDKKEKHLALPRLLSLTFRNLGPSSAPTPNLFH